jgi:hypothetical protein
MAYDNTKDKLIEELGQVPGTDLFAEVRSYDDGEKKVSVFRKVGKDGEKRRQVCRLTYPQVTHLGEFLVDFSATEVEVSSPEAASRLIESIRETAGELPASWGV